MNNHAEAERGFPAFLTLSWAWQESLEDPAAVRAALAHNLRHHRDGRGLSRKALGKAACVNLAAIRDIEEGRSLADIATLTRLADALRTSCGALVECGVSMTTPTSRRISPEIPAHEARTALA